MKKEILISKDYLLIPVRAEGEHKKAEFFVGEEKIFEFMISVKEEKPYAFHYYASLPVGEWKNKVIRIEGELPESFAEAVIQSEKRMPVLGQRPSIHFSPQSGWLNDPNGMMYHDGIYHLFFQHNPFDTRWENMSWGHAVSTDMLHWEDKGDVLFPDEDGTMFSGSGMVNEHGMLGLPNDAEILFYTSAGGASSWSKNKKFVQKVAYSMDHGKTAVKMPGCILEECAFENRDPKVYYHEQRGLYYMVLYLEKNDYAIFNSSNLQNWEMTQRLTLLGAWECPDLVELPVEGGGTKWMFWSADGYYFLGDFDGSRFETDGIRHEAYRTMLPYAAQSFWGTERKIMIPWMRSANAGKVYTSVMGIPRQLSLVEENSQYSLLQKPIDELKQCKVQEVFETKQNENEQELIYTGKEEAATEIILMLEDAEDFTIDLYGTLCVYNGKSGIMTITGVAPRAEGVIDAAKNYDKEQIPEGREDMRILDLGTDLENVSFISDGEILEITGNSGRICAAYETVSDRKVGTVRVCKKENIRAEVYSIK